MCVVFTQSFHIDIVGDITNLHIDIVVEITNLHIDIVCIKYYELAY